MTLHVTNNPPGGHEGDAYYGDAHSKEEVLRIKGILDKHNEESDADAVLLDSLRMLQAPLSFHTLKSTMIGKSVNALRKHGSKEIRNLAGRLIKDWKKVVDSWLDATNASTDPRSSCEEQKLTNIERTDMKTRTPPKDMKTELKRCLDSETGTPKLSNYDDVVDEGDVNLMDCNGEVLRIRAILDYPEESDATLLHYLRRLQLMSVSLYTLKATGIGKSVNALRKHGSKEIRNIVKRLIMDWKEIVDLWLDTTNAIADPRGCEEQDQYGGSDRSMPTSVENIEVHKLKNLGANEPRALPKDNKANTALKMQAPPKPNGPPGAAKPSNYASGQRRLNSADEKNPMLQQEMKLEAASRRLRERYEEVENAKKRRKIVFLGNKRDLTMASRRP